MNRAIEAVRIIRAPNISFVKAALAVFIGLGAYFSFFRYYEGLGAVTNLSDEFPWGLWIGFDVLCGVALAAGGFCIAATVYIFHLERYRPILRSTILTAFLGYLLVCMGLMYDLGKFYNIWRPIVLWNPHSVMFEVAWCVILYTAVLGLEFAPVLLEVAGAPRQQERRPAFAPQHRHQDRRRREAVERQAPRRPAAQRLAQGPSRVREGVARRRHPGSDPGSSASSSSRSGPGGSSAMASPMRLWCSTSSAFSSSNSSLTRGSAMCRRASAKKS